MKTVTIDFRAITRWLRVLITPSVWVCLEPYSREWDQKLRELMREHRFGVHPIHPGFWALLGPVRVWITNRPYSTMRPAVRRMVDHFAIDVPADFRPSRATILEALDKYDREVVADQTARMPS